MLSEREFTRRMIQTVATVTAVAIGTAVLWVASDVLMLVYVSALIAMGFSPLVRGIERPRNANGRARVPRVFAILAGCLMVAAGDGVTMHAQTDALTELLRQLEQVVQRGDPSAFVALLDDVADRDQANGFAETEFPPGATRVVIQERERGRLAGTLPGDGYRLVVEAFVQSNDEARVATWQLDVRRSGDGGAGPLWQIANHSRISSVENLYRLSLNPAKQFAARNLKIDSDDLELTLPAGQVFVAEVGQSITAAVLLGRGQMSFHPTPAIEKGQVKIFAGSETLDTPFDAVYLRMDPSDFDELIEQGALTAAPVDARELRRADDIFREDSTKSFSIDLGGLTPDAWSVLPGAGDFVAEIRTRRFNQLTYARSARNLEDVNLFDRKRRRTIALYASERALAARGPTFDEDDQAGYDVLDYTVDLAFTPERQWLEGRAKIDLRVRANFVSSITLRLASPLAVQSIVSKEFGWLFGMRVSNQDSFVINLPATLLRDAELSLTIAYAGRLEPQAPDRETLALQRQGADPEGASIVLIKEPSYLYSTGGYWYPQPSGSDYATATLRITVPAAFACRASGHPVEGSPSIISTGDPSQARKLYTFAATQPVRYLAFVVSRFTRTEKTTIDLPPIQVDLADLPPGDWYRNLDLVVEANQRQGGLLRGLSERTTDIVRFYEGLTGDIPYPSFSLALVENDLPGGHSPGYFAVLHQPLPTAPHTWRNDPAAFSNFPDFFLAHEIAHQWWGQAVGWRNYHEQWLSEGFAQYFAALYAQHQRGDDTFASVMRQMRKWAIDQSDQGPISLGYRLGHIRGDSRVFRAIAYNKSAVVLHMLRGLVGEETFFRGLRRFYRTSRFRKVGTEEFRKAMEAEAGRPLQRFFDRWINGSTLPRVKFSYRVEGGDVILHAEQIGEIFDLPLTVTLQYTDRKTTDVVLLITDRTSELRVPLTGTLRSVDISKDEGTIAEIVKN